MPTLDQLIAGQRARVEEVLGEDALVQRLMEMGLLEGEEMEVIGFAPLGDPMEIRLRDYRLSLRRNEAARIRVTAPPLTDLAMVARSHAHWSPWSATPTPGKTTLFNALAGMNQRVGNYPGVTVETKKGKFRHHGHADRSHRFARHLQPGPTQPR